MVDKVESLKLNLSELFSMTKFKVPGSNPGGNPKNLQFHDFKFFVISVKNCTTFILGILFLEICPVQVSNQGHKFFSDGLTLF